MSFLLGSIRWPRLALGAVTALSLTLGGCTTLPARGQVVMRDVSFPLRDFRMPSGLRVVVERDARSPVVAVVAVVGAGGSSDPSGKEGLAHLVEHLAFRARPANGASVMTRLEASGAGHFNASTSLDFTAYETLAPREALATLVKLEGERLSSPIANISPEVFAVEREVVRNELRQRNETGYVGQVFSWVHAASFPAGDPYSRPVVGSHESLTALTLGDAQRFARAHYRPENVTLVISGDVDLEAVANVLQQNLPPAWAGTGAPLAPDRRMAAQPSEPPAAPATKTLPVFTAAVPSPELYLSWVLPRAFDEASAVHDFVEASLDDNLWASMRNDGDIAGISTGLVPGTRASLLIVRVQLSRGDHPERTAEKVLDQVHKAWSQDIEAGGVLGQEFSFQALRRQVVTGMVLESERLLARTKSRALLTHFTTDVRSYTRSQMALVGLGGSKVTDFAYQWLQRNRAHAILVRPGESGIPGMSVNVATVALGGPGVEGGQRITPSMLTATTGPLQVLKLDNGLEVLLAPRPGLPVVRMAAAMAGGTAHGAKPGVGELARKGAFRESFFEGNPSDWGLHRRSSTSLDHVRVDLAGTAGNVGNMLAMLSEDLATTRTSEAQVRFLREQVLPWYAAVDTRPEVVAQRELMHALYGTHPYASDATSAQLAQVSWSEAQAWLEDVYRPGNTVVVVAGEFDVKEVEALARKYLGGWSRGKPQPVAVPPAPALPPASPRVSTLFTARPGATQGQVRMACRLPTATPELEARYALMAELLEVKAYQQTRSGTGASYGFGATPWIGRGGAAHLEMDGNLDAQRLQEGVGALRATLAALAKQVPAENLEQARGRILAQQAVSFIGTDAWVGALLQARVRGFPVEAVAQRPAHLQAVTAEALQQEFAGCLQRLVVSVTGDEAPSRAALQAVSVP
ncbi:MULTISPECIES: pitrilysin family protein [Corallococcus]|uniref:M16 family metallopeptidase n=1 Tax=Corallococcus TaxID=83461 RepID=UPI00117FEE83|nr:MULTISPECIES: insulinase family protein [Corallococcus]NBD12235.1 insulinase family protein [Corallococcus silvisoli]TSC25189.1 insulinase family protein [Corallococcus sp. Z5C101001]